MLCKQLSRLQVVTEWQEEIFCPTCHHYCKGRCGNPARTSDKDSCPFEDTALENFTRPVDKRE
jgi:hypothetical protein